MREIRFRAWDKVNKRMLRVVTMSSGWMEGCNGWFITGEYTTDEILTIHPQYGPALIVKQYKLDIINHELMQFTGLHDKNGKEIWEGDRIKDNVNGLIWEVFWNEAKGQWFARWDYVEDPLFNRPLDKRIEVIGNIYSNPELLEKKK